MVSDRSWWSYLDREWINPDDIPDEEENEYDEED
jgi:hypothetical protein